jgi:hypothetical protein
LFKKREKENRYLDDFIRLLQGEGGSEAREAVLHRAGTLSPVFSESTGNSGAGEGFEGVLSLG